MIGLSTVAFLGAEDGAGDQARIHVETKASLVGCPRCGVLARVKERSAVELVDLALFGRPTRLVWHKRRWMCPDGDCAMASWTEQDDRIAGSRQVLTSRAARWATIQVGRCARSVNEVATELGCDWHTVNDTVVSYGEALLEADTERIGAVSALGLDEVVMVRTGPFHRQHFSTQIVDVGAGQLLDVVPGRGSAEPMAWLSEQTTAFLEGIEFGTLDLSGPYRRVFEIIVPGATLVADPFHVVKHANTKLDECRRRVQNETLGHRGRKSDPLYRCRRLLTKAKERLDEAGHERLTGLLRAGDPHGDVATLWEAKEAVRELYAHGDAEVALEWVTQLGHDLQDKDYPIEARSLGRTLLRWKHQIAAWHHAHVSNGPTEAVNNLIKRVKRAAFGFTSFRNYRIRSLLYAGKPNWNLLATLTPR
ncbi:MAG: ISL3 family transposase [Pseudonocardiaceae bacterium]